MKKAIYLVPAAALLVVVLALPLAAAIPSGLPRLPELLRDRTLPEVAFTTTAFAAVSVALELLLGLLFALALDRSFRLRGLARAMALLPWALPTAVMALSWRWIFSDTYGVAGDLAVRLGLADAPVPWLARPGSAFAALVVADVWKTTPFVTILLLAGLQSVPQELHEAMSVDGAGPVRRFFRITLPLLRPALALALTFRLIQAAGLFDLAWVLTGGGPGNATKTVALHIYDHTFRFGDPGYGAALAIATAAALFAVAGGLGLWVRGRAVS